MELYFNDFDIAGLLERSFPRIVHFEEFRLVWRSFLRQKRLAQLHLAEVKRGVNPLNLDCLLAWLGLGRYLASERIWAARLR